MIIISIYGVLTLAYIILMLAYRKGWKKQPDFEIDDDFIPRTAVSVIVPARNEEENIGVCIDAILAQDYPKDLLEIIVVDDHSTDNTAGIIRPYNTQGVIYINLADVIGDNEVRSYKKQALAKGIERSKGDVIVTTDADCVAGKHWITHIVALYQKEQSVMIVAPVDFSSNNSVLEKFQSLDFMSMQGITAAALNMGLGNMSNGANLAFTKAAFHSVNGYEGVDHIASGDDYLLMMKFNSAYPNKISYLKAQEAIVSTPPQKSWKDFLQQRIRWSSKSGKYNDSKITTILLFVYVFNLSFFIAAIGMFFYYPLFGVLICMFLLKTEVELIYLYPVSKFFKKTSQIVTFAFYQPLHIAYIILAGFLGFVGVYKWKGRKVK